MFTNGSWCYWCRCCCCHCISYQMHAKRFIIARAVAAAAEQEEEEWKKCWQIHTSWRMIWFLQPIYCVHQIFLLCVFAFLTCKWSEGTSVQHEIFAFNRSDRRKLHTKSQITTNANDKLPKHNVSERTKNRTLHNQKSFAIIFSRVLWTYAICSSAQLRIQCSASRDDANTHWEIFNQNNNQKIRSTHTDNLFSAVFPS